MFFFITLFLMVPFAETWLLIAVGSYIGTLNTIALVAATAIIGGITIRIQGTEILWSVKSKLTQGQIPAGELFTGLMLIVAGILLCTPGFFTDFFGSLLLIPWIRWKCGQTIKKRILGDLSDWPGGKMWEAGSMHEQDGSGNTFVGEIEIPEDKEH